MFLSARPVRAATVDALIAGHAHRVSIRAARAGRDDFAGESIRSFAGVSIRAARAGRDPAYRDAYRRLDKFLSARPVRAATRRCASGSRASTSFYPRGPCGPRRTTSVTPWRLSTFLSARPVRAATGGTGFVGSSNAQFLSARPVRAATTTFRSVWWCSFSFYPRGPCGPRPSCIQSTTVRACFYPRGPCGPRPAG